MTLEVIPQDDADLGTREELEQAVRDHCAARGMT